MTAEPTPTEQLFEMWRRGLDESARAWGRLLQPPAAPPDPAAFWRPLVDQWVQAWARVFAATPMTPDIGAQWKQFLDHAIDAWSRALGQAMNTEGFARLLSLYLDQWLVAYGPAKKAADQQVEQALQALNVASRSQLTAVAKQIVELEERVERVEDGIRTVLRRLDQLGRDLGRYAEAQAVAPRERG
ncbi:MAG TPA: hypothetical protein VNO23_07830 [Candidatus Binatia bacterium]|nr:hypothetical protein [Candidatus Binatia bacterium]